MRNPQDQHLRNGNHENHTPIRRHRMAAGYCGCSEQAISSGDQERRGVINSMRGRQDTSIFHTWKRIETCHDHLPASFQLPFVLPAGPP